MRKQKYWRMLLAAAFLFLLVPQAAQAAATEQKLLAGDGEADDWFGSSVSVSGNTAVIGAYGDNGATGSAYVFVRADDGTWSQQANLTADDGAYGDAFGSSVSVSGNTAVIGAYKDNGTTGSVYVFVRAADGTWSQKAKLTADDGEIGDEFGWSVAVSGNTAVIGADFDDDKGGDSGSAYVFVRAADGTWSQQAKLTADDGEAGDWFGESVAVSGGIAVIGAALDNAKGDDSGSAYVFVRAADGTWSQQAKLTADDGAAGDQFGWSVAVSGDTAVIGAFKDDDNGSNSGSAYVFVRAADGTWSQHVKLTADDGAAGDQFGWSVAVSGNTAVIGADWDDDNGSCAGSAYVFVRAADGTWSQHDNKLVATDGAFNDEFGLSVAVSGTTAVIGADDDDDRGDAAGSAYVFSFPCGYGRALPDNTWLMTAPACRPVDPAGISTQYGTGMPGGAAAYNTSWVGWSWDAAAQNYPPRMAAADPLALGFGNWLYSTNAGAVRMTGGTATPTTDCSGYGIDQCFEIEIAIAPAGQSRWNFVGHPFPYAVNWADVKVALSHNGGATWDVYSPSQAESAGYVSKAYYRWNGNGYDPYDDVTLGGGTLQPQEAVWVCSIGSYAAAPEKLKLLIPAR